MVTTRDMARAAGVSLSTVSRALDDLPLLRPPGGDEGRIRRLTAELGYERNALALRLIRAACAPHMVDDR
ncbi:MAG: LacI family DNA-binding transcriptional regulator [Candidatus Acetothermia bacterium]|nr:LacI family DNA-binding transcriptional regulator [Candidatus Acetothermia bacterium]